MCQTAGEMERTSAEWELDWVEYMSFLLTLLTSAAIGVYFGMIKGGQNTISGYLLGGKEMTVVPISISLITAYFSAIVILGAPSEVYTHGFNYGATIFSIMSIGFVSAYIVIPVFHKLQLVSPYEYIELRFGHRMKMAMSALFVLHQLSFVPTFIYAPAMAINQATKVNVHLVSFVMSGVCIFYTTVGGLKAVVWTDVLQGVVILLSLMAVLIVGTIRVGGIQSVITTSLEGGRLEFDFVSGLTKRMDFWSGLVGTTLVWMASCSFSPESIQRYTALPNLRDAQIAAFVLPLGLGIAFATCLGLALIVYAKFHDCDPLSSGLITRNDQLLPLFVLKVCGDIKGLGGLFFAGLVAGSLSSISASLNTLAGLIYRDFVSPHFRVTPSERNATLIMKGIVCVFGVSCVLIASFIDRLATNLVEIVAAFGGLIVGPFISIFLLGLLCPWVTNVGVIWGGLIGVFSTAWLTVARLVHFVEITSGYPIKPIRVDGCYNNITLHEILPRSTMESDLPDLYRLSPFWLSSLGIIIVVVASVVVSYLTGFNRLEDVNLDLISPLIHRFMPKKHKEYAPITLEMVELEKNDGSG